MSPSTANEPLIQSNEHREGRSTTSADSTPREDEHDADEASLGAPSTFIWLLTFSAGVSGLLFGYDTGVISSTLVSVDSDLSNRYLTTLDKSIVTSCTSLFALAASPAAGILSDALGRKTILVSADVLFVVGALWQAWATTVMGMVIGRSIVGLAIGSASFVAPLYISELAPSPFRGRLVTIQTLLITGGQVVAYTVGWLFSAQAHGWRWMVGLGALPAVIQFFTLAYLPETPRWLVKANHADRARRVLRKVYGGAGGPADRVVDGVLRRIEKEILEEEEAAAGRAASSVSPSGPKHGLRARAARIGDTLGELVGPGRNRRALAIACMLQGFQQLCGFNSLMYFSATIFALVGFRSPVLTALSVAGTNFLFTLVAFTAIDRVGRRRILLYSVPVMVAGLVLCAVAFGFVELPGAGPAAPITVAHKGMKTWPLIILLAMIIYVAGYAVGLGCVPWQQSELFPLAVRSLGSALATATNWGSNFIIGLTFLPMMDVLTPVGTFTLYAAVCATCWLCVWQYYPETAGLSLEEVGGLLHDGWGFK